MFSVTVFKHAVKSNYFLWLIVTLTTTIFLSATIFAVESLSSNGATLPGADGNIFSLLDQTFFSMIGILLPLIYIVVVSNKIISKEVDNGSMAFTLTTPIGRTRLFFSRLIFLFVSIVVMFAVITLGGLAAASTLSIDFDSGTMINLMMSLLFLELAFSGITILMSSIFNKSSLSIGIGAGLTLGMFLLSTIASLATDLEPLKYLSLVQFYDVNGIINQSESQMNIIVLGVVFVSLSSIGIQVFRKKNLPL
jgi:ABC-2 type transport system permease protein